MNRTEENIKWNESKDIIEKIELEESKIDLIYTEHMKLYSNAEQNYNIAISNFIKISVLFYSFIIGIISFVNLENIFWLIILFASHIIFSLAYTNVIRYNNNYKMIKRIEIIETEKRLGTNILEIDHENIIKLEDWSSKVDYAYISTGFIGLDAVSILFIFYMMFK